MELGARWLVPRTIGGGGTIYLIVSFFLGIINLSCCIVIFALGVNQKEGKKTIRYGCLYARRLQCCIRWQSVHFATVILFIILVLLEQWDQIKDCDGSDGDGGGSVKTKKNRENWECKSLFSSDLWSQNHFDAIVLKRYRIVFLCRSPCVSQMSLCVSQCLSLSLSPTQCHHLIANFPQYCCCSKRNKRLTNKPYEPTLTFILLYPNKQSRTIYSQKNSCFIELDDLISSFQLSISNKTVPSQERFISK